MLIVIEGPNGAGKSTLIDYLIDNYKAKTYHFSKDTDNSFKGHLSKLSEMYFAEELWIWDRGNLGESIYPILWNRQSAMTDIEKFTLYKVQECLNIPIIVFYSSNFETLKERLFKRGDEQYVLDTIETENQLWQELAHRLSVNHNNIFHIDIYKEIDQIKCFEELNNKNNWI